MKHKNRFKANGQQNDYASRVIDEFDYKQSKINEDEIEELPKGEIPVWLRPKKFNDLTDTPPRPLVTGVMNCGDKVSVQGSYKSRKTWFVMQMYYCLANGLPFLGLDVTKAKVLLVDLELREYFYKKRLKKIQAALGKGNFDNIEIIPLRGKVRQMDSEHIEYLIRSIKNGKYGAALIDPLYRLIAGQNVSEGRQRSENDNMAMAEFKLVSSGIWYHGITPFRVIPDT